MNNPIPAHLHIIAGNNTDKKIRASTTVFMVYRNLLTLAIKGSHWARVSASHLQSLSSGQFKSAVFVQQNNPFDASSSFTMTLPGCKAQILETADGEYLISKLEVDAHYRERQQNAEKPGFFSVMRDARGAWSTEHLSGGQVNIEKGRVVVISDQHDRLDTAVDLAVLAASYAPIGGRRFINSYGFDMHFTPGKMKIGGLRQLKQARNADTDPALHESAMLLAETMASARDLKSVSWISEAGGSGVLTQAMRILKDEGISFANSDHHIFFSNMTTRLTKAQSLASDIGMEFDGNAHNINRLNPNQLVGGLGFDGSQVKTPIDPGKILSMQR